MSYAFVDGKCPRCDGSGEIGGFDGLQICPVCNGTGSVGEYREVPDVEYKGPSALAYKLRQTRERRKVGMGDLAKYFGWSVVHLSNIETGKVEMTEEERKQVSDWIYA